MEEKQLNTVIRPHFHNLSLRDDTTSMQRPPRCHAETKFNLKLPSDTTHSHVISAVGCRSEVEADFVLRSLGSSRTSLRNSCGTVAR